jgi:signal transduction histidine kinase
MMSVELDGHRLLLVNAEGTPTAYEDQCVHQDAPLSDGALEGCVLRCARHGWKFDVRTGEGLEPRNVRLRAYLVEVEGDEIRVGLPDASDGGAAPVLLDGSRHELDLAEITRELLQRTREVAERARCELTFSVTGAATGRWDRLRLEHIVGNLLANAFKFGAGHPVEIRLEADDAAVVRLVVRDGGAGIGTERPDDIFERVERVSGGARRGGVGLWIARESAAALGGTIRVVSVAGAGATFTVELPRGA